MVDIQTVSIAIASAGVFVAAVYYILQIRHQSKVRQTDLVMRLYSTSSSDEYIHAFQKFMATEFKDYADYKDKYVSPSGYSEKPEHLARIKVLLFYQGVGVLLKMKLIDINLTHTLFINWPIFTWEKMKPIIEGVRIENGTPHLYSEYEYLYNEIKKREQQLASKTA